MFHIFTFVKMLLFFNLWLDLAPSRSTQFALSFSFLSEGNIENNDWRSS